MISVGILNARGKVGKQLIYQLINHPQFNVTVVGSHREKRFGDLVEWDYDKPLPKSIANLHTVRELTDFTENCDVILSALGANAALETEAVFAQTKPVISCASAYRNDPYVPMVIPEVNAHHTNVITAQQEHYTREGFIAVKPNCSIQSYMLPLHVLREAGVILTHLTIDTKQAMSGAGQGDIDPMKILGSLYAIPSEAQKAENEPLKIFGTLGVAGIQNTAIPIDANCYRVPVDDGHMATVTVETPNAPNLDQIIEIWNNFPGLNLHSAPKQPLRYLANENRPNSKMDAQYANGMGITIGGLKKTSRGFSFTAVSHNRIRGAAGGAVLLAELLLQQGYLNK